MSYYRQNQGHRKLLGWFILLSLLAHGLLLMLTDRPVQKNYRPEFSSPIQVTVVSSRVEHSIAGSGTVARHLDNDREQATPAAQMPELSKQEAITGLSSVDTVSRNEEKVKSIPAAVEEMPEETGTVRALASGNLSFAESSPAAAETDSQENLSLNHLLHQLRALIKARFTYPRVARRMGWEGLVALSLHIEDDGSLHNVSIARSSGHKVLDENARSTVERIGRLQVASSLNMQAVDTEVEVLYRLTD